VLSAARSRVSGCLGLARQVGTTAMLLEPAAESPAERVRLVCVPVADEPAQRTRESLEVGEVAVRQHAPMQDPEPDLDLVHPRRVERRVDEVEPSSMLLAQALPRLAAVDVEVVPDHVHLTGHAGGDRLHELEKLLGGPPLAHLDEDLAGRRRTCARSPTSVVCGRPRLAKFDTQAGSAPPLSARIRYSTKVCRPPFRAASSR
jgi:hypothetical protein